MISSVRFRKGVRRHGETMLAQWPRSGMLDILFGSNDQHRSINNHIST